MLRSPPAIRTRPPWRQPDAWSAGAPATSGPRSGRPTRGARCGSTSRANRSMLRLHSSVGIEPKCRSASRCPMRSRLMPSMSCSRTVFGLPTTTKPRVEEILGLELAQIDPGARIVLQRLHQRAVFEAARNRLIILRRVEQLVKEILGVRGVEILRLGIGLGHADELQEAEPVRIVVAPLARNQLPITVAHLLRVLGAVIAQMAEAMIAGRRRTRQSRKCRSRESRSADAAAGSAAARD